MAKLGEMASPSASAEGGRRGRLPGFAPVGGAVDGVAGGPQAAQGENSFVIDIIGRNGQIDDVPGRADGLPIGGVAVGAVDALAAQSGESGEVGGVAGGDGQGGDAAAVGAGERLPLGGAGRVGGGGRCSQSQYKQE